MKQIDNFILEKLKLNKDIKINTYFDYKDSNFNNSDLDKITEFIGNLPISPKEVILSDDGNTIVLKYTNLIKENEFTRIFFLIEGEGYLIGFRKTLDDNVIFYPSATKGVHFDSIEECFDCINENWQTWQKYFD